MTGVQTCALPILAYRRCELAWVNGDQIGVNFLKQDKKKKTRRTQAAEA